MTLMQGAIWQTAYIITVQCTLLPLHVVAAGGSPALMCAFENGICMCHA